MSRVFTTLGRWLLVLSMIIAMGGHWIVLQSVAWTSMMISNARHESLACALENTFDGDHPCSLCKRISKGSSSEKKHDIQAPANKLNLFCENNTITLLRPGEFHLQTAPDAFAQALLHPPLLQPPRIAAALAISRA